MRILLSIFCLLISQISIAQYSISGQLVDKESRSSLANAHIGIMGTSMGTVSNENGYFIFNYSAKHRNSILKISFLGYTPILINLSEVKSRFSARFSMIKTSRELNEIVITTSEDTIKQMVEEAVLNLRKNLLNKPYSAKGFYREYDKQDGKYVRLVESAITMRDQGYNKNIHQGVKIRVDELKKSEDNIDLDWKSAISNWFYDHNGLYRLLKDEPFRKKDGMSFFEIAGGYSPKNYNIDPNEERIIKGEGGLVYISSNYFLAGFDFNLIETIIEDSVTYYRIKFENPYADRVLMVGDGELLINSSDNMIIEYKAYLRRTDKTDGLGLIPKTVPTIVSKYEYKFKKHNKKYYLYYAESNSIGTNSGVGVFGRNWNKFEEDGSGLLYKHKQYLVNNITNDKVKKRHIMADNDDIYDENIKYNSKFWEGYNIIVDLPMEEKLKQDLTKYIN